MLSAQADARLIRIATNMIARSIVIVLSAEILALSRADQDTDGKLPSASGLEQGLHDARMMGTAHNSARLGLSEALSRCI